MLRPRFMNKPEPFNPDNHSHTNRTIRWRAEFMGEHNKLYCAGKAPRTYRHTDVYGNTYTYTYTYTYIYRCKARSVQERTGQKGQVG